MNGGDKVWPYRLAFQEDRTNISRFVEYELPNFKPSALATATSSLVGAPTPIGPASLPWANEMENMQMRTAKVCFIGRPNARGNRRQAAKRVDVLLNNQLGRALSPKPRRVKATSVYRPALHYRSTGTAAWCTRMIFEGREILPRRTDA